MVPSKCPAGMILVVYRPPVQDPACRGAEAAQRGGGPIRAPGARHTAGTEAEMPPVQGPACRGPEAAQRGGGAIRGSPWRLTQHRD